MHILIFNWRDPKNPLSGGAEIVTMQHAKAWVKAGHKVTWFTSSFEKSKGAEIIDGVSIVRRGNSLTVFLFAPLFYLFSRLSFDVVIDEIHGIPFFTPFFVRKPKIAFIHEVAGEIWDYMYPFPFNLFGKIAEKIYFIFYKNIPFWTVSDSSKKDLIDMGIPLSHIQIITNTITMKVAKVIPIKEKKSTFLFVSRLVKMKGIENVLEAFRIFVKSDPESVLWIIGSGEKLYRESLERKIKDIKQHVKFLGRLTDKEKKGYLGRAHLLLHASIKEGWGLVVSEAASQGTPSVVYNSPGLRDSVKSGKTGIVLRINSPEEMAKQVQLLINNKTLYKDFQNNCLLYARTLESLHPENESRKLLETYNTVTI